MGTVVNVLIDTYIIYFFSNDMYFYLGKSAFSNFILQVFARSCRYKWDNFQRKMLQGYACISRINSSFL